MQFNGDRYPYYTNQKFITANNNEKEIFILKKKNYKTLDTTVYNNA